MFEAKYNQQRDYRRWLHQPPWPPSSAWQIKTDLVRRWFADNAHEKMIKTAELALQARQLSITRAKWRLGTPRRRLDAKHLRISRFSSDATFSEVRRRRANKLEPILWKSDLENPMKTPPMAIIIVSTEQKTDLKKCLDFSGICKRWSNKLASFEYFLGVEIICRRLIRQKQTTFLRCCGRLRRNDLVCSIVMRKWIRHKGLALYSNWRIVGF